MTSAFDRDLIAAMPMLKATAIGITRNGTAAEDLVQDTLERAIRHQDTFEPGTDLGKWLRCIMRNCYINGWRKNARYKTTPMEPEIMALFPVPARQENIVYLREAFGAIAALPAHHQTALQLACEGIPMNEAAHTHHVPIGTVRSRIFRARAAITALAGQ